MSDKLPSPEKECPECGGKISWKSFVTIFGSPFVNGLCSKCNIIFRNRQDPQVTEGENLELEGEIGGVKIKDIPAMDKRITSLPCNVQIGILRQRQHKNDSV